MIRSAKKLRMVLILCLVLLSGLLFWLSSFQQAGSPVFSHESGFYEDVFLLEISAPGAGKIYYTLDGSLPDETDLEYTGPIRIDNATFRENRDSMRTDVSAGFRTDLLEHYQAQDSNPHYAVPDYPVDKCTVIRAVAVSPGGVKSEPVSASYFVELSAGDFGGSKILSLVTDPDNLYDYETGIYVMGQVFDRYMETGQIDPLWHFWDANYRQRGADWERPADLTFFGSDGTLLLSQAGGIRTHGGFSRSDLPRSLNLYTRLDYSGRETFGFAPFASDYMPQRMFLSSGGNAILTQFPDYMMTQMVRELNFSTMLMEPCVLFLNGEYWGFYWLSEKYDEDYLKHYYQVEENNVIIIKNNLVEAGRESDLNTYTSMREFISGKDMAQEENYRQACQLIDVESCIDFYATMIYIARCEDWPNENEACWRARNSAADNPWADGKWRWMLFDCNSTSMRDDYGLTTQNTLTYVLERDTLFASLWNNPDFREAFADRILYIGRNCLEAEKMDGFIRQYMQTVTPMLEKSWDRFYGRDSILPDYYAYQMESYNAFFRGRLETVESWFR